MDDSSAGLINPTPVVHERKAHRRNSRRHGTGVSSDTAIPALLLNSASAWEPQRGGEVVVQHDVLAPPAGGEQSTGREPIDALEVFEHLRDITDPEHPYTLEQLNVVEERLIDVDDTQSRVKVQFTPTVAHCSMATLIGLSLRVKLMRTLPTRFKVDVRVTPGAHSSEAAVNKQLADKERVAAALENPNLLDMVNRSLASSEVDNDGNGSASVGREA